jgi:diguanylate cyclase (GGDEF)-like protein
VIDDAPGDAPALRYKAGYRRLALMFGLALAVLVGTTVYLVVRDRLDTWAAARTRTHDISIAVQVSISGLLAQPVASLRGIRARLSRDSPDRIDATALLRDAMRFDPLSSYLGIRRAGDGTVVAVDAEGNPVSPALAAALQALLPTTQGTGVEVSQLVLLPGNTARYMPLTLAAGNGDAGGASSGDTLFALVDGPRLVAGVRNLYPAANALESVLTTDGRRIIASVQGTESYRFDGRIRPESLAIINRTETGNYESTSTYDGVHYVFGFSRSPSLPIAITTGVPVSTLNAEWVRQSMPVTVLLLLGVGGIVGFGLRLRDAQHEQWAYLRKQEYLANHDTLTGLRNRDSFMRLLAREIKRAPAQPFGVLVMDLINFKDINDTLGHAAGDQLLCELGQRLSERLETEEASVARLGGDEIGVFIRRGDGDALAGFSAELHECISRRVLIDGVGLEPVASMGGALYPEDAGTPSELMRRADIAMYVAKAGSLPYCRYAERMDSFSPDRLAMKAELATAIREEALHLVYQPKVRMNDGAMVGCEALARWMDPLRGPVSPATFIPIIERSELIHPFTEHVLRTALAQSRLWRAAGYQIPVAVNISANNLHDDRFIAKLIELLAADDIPAHLLELEITESAVMRNPDVTIERLRALREFGLQLSIDDFGTGHASLAYLKHLPVHTLKIDQAFIRELGSDAANRRIVASAIHLAHGFGMTVVAEGVETGEAADLLNEYGCDYAQGYHFARPLAPGELESGWFMRCARVVH